MFSNTKVRTWILGIFGVISGGLLLLVGVVWVSASATHTGMSKISAALYPAALHMQQAAASFERMKKFYGDAVVLQDQTALKNGEKAAQATEDALNDTRNALAGMPDLQKQADGLLTQFASIRSNDRDTYGAILASTGGPTDEQMGKVGLLGKDNLKLTDAMSGFSNTISANFQSQLDALNAWSIRSRIVGIVMLIFALISCGVAWWVVQFKVALPLAKLVMYMQDIAEGEGDLTRRIAVAGHTEIDEVGIWFNTFIERVEHIVLQVAQHAQTLGAAAIQLEHMAVENAERATQQEQQAERINTAMQEMTAAVQEITQTTQLAAKGASQAEESAKTGGATVQETIHTIGDLVKANEETSAKIEELGCSSDAIGKIINVINEIASQTNLLALNASIEAARAGEHGRGFAVVASEVRRLAERTSSATKEIDATVRAIQEGTHEAVESMRSSMSHVQEGVHSARSSGGALSSIIQGSESVQMMVTQIASAATEQSFSVQSVSSNVQEIATIIQQTRSGFQEAASSCKELSRLANEMSQLVGSFKVNEEHLSSAA
jgi:methyl-accepting chemotaxis protein